MRIICYGIRTEYMHCPWGSAMNKFRCVDCDLVLQFVVFNDMSIVENLYSGHWYLKLLKIVICEDCNQILCLS